MRRGPAEHKGPVRVTHPSMDRNRHGRPVRRPLRHLGYRSVAQKLTAPRRRADDVVALVFVRTLAV